MFTHTKSPQSCPTLCDSVDCSPPGSSVHGILQVRGCHALFEGIFPVQGLNPPLLCLLHRQAGSLPLMPLGKPQLMFMGVTKRQTLSEGFPCFISFNPHNASLSQQLSLCHLGGVETGSEIICPGTCSTGLQTGSQVPEPMLFMIVMTASSTNSVLTLSAPKTRLSVSHNIRN